MTAFRSLSVVLLGCLVAACGDLFGPGGPIKQLPRELTAAEQSLIEADNRFAFKLFREINAQEDPGTNVFVSPLSVAMALGLAYNGAAGATREAMGQTLEFGGMNVTEVNQAYRDLIDLLRELDSRVELLIANSVWHRQEVTVLPEFVQTVGEYFDADVTALDFSDPAAADIMNAWVREATAGRIESIVDDPIDANVIAHLLNAVYFKGEWTHQFDRDRTVERPFELTDGSQATVEMMYHRGFRPLRHMWGDDVEVVELPYGRDAYNMVIVMPSTPQAIGELTSELTQEQWNGWIADLDSTEGTISMPRFTLEYELTLNDVLKALGMEIAFSEAADFSNMFGTRGPYIGEVKHKTFVEVTEEGTEAAAATNAVMVVSHGGPHMVVDRPFLFVIRERFSGTILFMGKIMNPAAS